VEGSLAEFGRALVGHLPDLGDPLNVFVLPGSPLDVVVRMGQWPAVHLGALLVAAGFVAVCWLAGRWVRDA
jgi:hypothetical protein